MSFGYIGDISTKVKQNLKNQGILTTPESFDLERQGFLGGSLEFIETKTPSGVAQIDFTNIKESLYDVHMIQMLSMETTSSGHPEASKMQLRFSNDGGVMSEGDKEEYAELYVDMFQNQTDLERISAVPVNSRTEEQKQKLVDLQKQAGVIRREIQDFELAQASLFEQTAENRSRNKTILWWVLNMAYIVDYAGENPEQIFAGETHEKRLVSYDFLEESTDPFHEELLKKLVYYVSYWYVGSAQTEEEFKKLLAELEESGLQETSMEAIEKAESKKAKKIESAALNHSAELQKIISDETAALESAEQEKEEREKSLEELEVEMLADAMKSAFKKKGE